MSTSKLRMPVTSYQRPLGELDLSIMDDDGVGDADLSPPNQQQQKQQQQQQRSGDEMRRRRLFMMDNNYADVNNKLAYSCPPKVSATRQQVSLLPPSNENTTPSSSLSPNPRRSLLFDSQPMLFQMPPISVAPSDMATFINMVCFRLLKFQLLIRLSY